MQNSTRSPLDSHKSSIPTRSRSPRY
jgi:hypothetical protein